MRLATQVHPRAEHRAARIHEQRRLAERRAEQVVAGEHSASTVSWTARCDTLRRYSRWAGANVSVMPGGQIGEDAIRVLAECPCVTEVHVGRAARADKAVDSPISAAAVSVLKRAASGSR